MNHLAAFIPPRPAALESRVASEGPATDAAMTSVQAKAIGKMLAGLLNDETALYAITRDWRYDTAGRKFQRLHALLDEQFSEIGVRLTRLAARSRDLDSWNSTGPGERVATPRTAVVDGTLQAYMIRELLSLHETLIAGLK